MDEFTEHPQNHFVSVRTSGGEMKILAPGAVINGIIAPLGAVPDLNSNGINIRDEFG